MTAAGGGKLQWAEAFAFSALLHAGLVYMVLDISAGFDLARNAADDSPDLIVTNITLDADLVASVEAGETDPAALLGTSTDILPPVADDPDALTPVQPEDDGPAPEPDVAEPEPVPPEPAEPVTPPEEIAATEPAVPVETATDSLTPVEPDLVPETLATAAPETLAPATTAEAEALSPVAAPVANSAPIALSPVRPRNGDDDGVAALSPTVSADQASAPVTLAPVSPVIATAVAAPVTTASARPATSTANAIAPVRPGVSNLGSVSVDTATLSPTPLLPVTSQPESSRPAAAPAQPPTPEQVAIRTLLERIRGQFTQTCLVAFPRLDEDGVPELVMLAANDSTIRDFAAAVLDGFSPLPGQRVVLVDPRQCEALNLVRANPQYPAFPLSVRLDALSIESGSELSGQVFNGGGLYLSLLLVDDNGVVQDLGSYLSFTAQGARFSVPLSRAGPARDTSQILLVLGTDLRPATLDSMNGQLASDFFAALRDELGDATPLVLFPFDVR
jgi:hypothetical protein